MTAPTVGSRRSPHWVRTDRPVRFAREHLHGTRNTVHSDALVASNLLGRVPAAAQALGHRTNTHQGNPVDANLTPGQIETAVATQLFEAGVTGSPTTALALTLARRIDCRIDTGSAIAACSRELRSLLDELQAATPTFDIVTS